MTPQRIPKLATGYAFLAGATDFGTGLLLMGAPSIALRLMLIPLPGAEALVFVRFVGAFVAAVGSMYLWAAVRPRERLRVVLGVTVLPRLFAGTFALVAAWSRRLPLPWLSVTATDYMFVLVQAWLLTRPLAE
ncbi:MAG TPA: hypothetical protein VHE61_03165 [Opitutaceae bacterium]|nr:hypothetical protein [Opitutaceae bacterium]